MMARGWLLLLCLLGAPLQASVLDLSALQRQMAETNTLRCQFQQEKRVAGLAAPLRSSGSLLFHRASGLWWQQSAPFAMTLLLDDSRLVQQVADGEPDVITAQKNPRIFEFAHLLLGLFGGEPAALEQAFTLEFHGGASGWRLLLRPRQAPLDKIFSGLEMTGKDLMESLVIRDQGGDETRLTFSGCSRTPDTLSDDERRHFAR